MYYLYILRNENNSYYIGTTNNLQRRIHEHNSDQSKYTKNRGLWRIFFTENYSTRTEAVKREYYLKSLKSKQAIIELIRCNQPG